MSYVQPREVRVVGCVFTTLVTLLLWCSSAFGWSATREETAGRWLIVAAADGEANRFDINSSGDGMDEAFGGADYDELAGDSGDDRLTGGDGDDQI